MCLTYLNFLFLFFHYNFFAAFVFNWHVFCEEVKVKLNDALLHVTLLLI